MYFDSAIASHVGIVRSNNQDAGYAGDQLFFVADGMGGHAAGDVASAMVTRAVAEFDNALISNSDNHDTFTPDSVIEDFVNCIEHANDGLADAVSSRPELSGMGTTFVGFAVLEDKFLLAHIGDSRLYCFRGKHLEQITKDHTFVQKLVDAGRITPEEAATHPRRSVLMRVLGDVQSEPEFDTEVLTPEIDDIWLLCSDGLAGYVADKIIERELRQDRPLQDTVDALIDRALEAGAPDNVTVLLVRPTTEAIEAKGPRFAGSATDNFTAQIRAPKTKRPVLLRPKKAKAVEETQFEPKVEAYLSLLLEETRRNTWRRRIIWASSITLLLLILGGIALFGYKWSQTRYFVGVSNGHVAIYQGIQQNVGPLVMHHPVEESKLSYDALGGFAKMQVDRTINADSLEDARLIVERLGVNGR